MGVAGAMRALWALCAGAGGCDAWDVRAMRTLWAGRTGYGLWAVGKTPKILGRVGIMHTPLARTHRFPARAVRRTAVYSPHITDM